MSTTKVRSLPGHEARLVPPGVEVVFTASMVTASGLILDAMVENDYDLDRQEVIPDQWIIRVTIRHRDYERGSGIASRSVKGLSVAVTSVVDDMASAAPGWAGDGIEKVADVDWVDLGDEERALLTDADLALHGLTSRGTWWVAWGPRVIRTYRRELPFWVVDGIRMRPSAAEHRLALARAMHSVRATLAQRSSSLLYGAPPHGPTCPDTVDGERCPVCHAH